MEAITSNKMSSTLEIEFISLPFLLYQTLPYLVLYAHDTVAASALHSFSHFVPMGVARRIRAQANSSNMKEATLADALRPSPIQRARQQWHHSIHSIA